MPKQVCMGAVLQCSCGTTRSSLVVLPTNMVITSGMPAATIEDHRPLENILPFGQCASPTNPTVAAATTTALGELTPMPCIPATVAPWAPGSPTVLIANKPSLTNASTLHCKWDGLISIVQPGQESHTSS